jgi:hypothetical protein
MGLFERTAALIRYCRFVVYEGCGHGGTFTDRRFVGDVLAFLKAENLATPLSPPSKTSGGGR